MKLKIPLKLTIPNPIISNVEMSKNGRHDGPNLGNNINSTNNYTLKKCKIVTKRRIGVLFTGEGLAFDGGVELIAPAEATRFARPTENSSSDQAPIPRPEIADKTT